MDVVIQNRTPHCCLQNAQTLILDWLHAVLEGKPRANDAYGYLRVEFSGVVDEWKKPVFNSVSSRIAVKGKSRSGELVCRLDAIGDIREEWLTFIGRLHPARRVEAVT